MTHRLYYIKRQGSTAWRMVRQSPSQHGNEPQVRILLPLTDSSTYCHSYYDTLNHTIVKWHLKLKKIEFILPSLLLLKTKKRKDNSIIECYKILKKVLIKNPIKQTFFKKGGGRVKAKKIFVEDFKIENEKKKRMERLLK